MPNEILITGGYVVTFDDALGDVPGGDVRVLDGVTPQMTGYGYGPAVLTGISLKHTPADIYAGTLWGALQALDAGITTIGDWAHALQSADHADADLRGLRESGIRGVFFYGGPGPASTDPNPPHPLDARRMRDEQFPADSDTGGPGGHRAHGEPGTHAGPGAHAGPGKHGRLRMGMALRGPCFTMVHEVALHQRDMLRLATLSGAEVLGLADQTGSLTPGKQADIAVVDLRSPHLDGFGDPVAMLGLGAGPADVETVLVGGEFAKRDGVLAGPHATEARALMHETQDRLRATIG
ncbi:amidohydrolase family protein [Catenulispora pinistramenti]|nr:amidohydrolase family protein [Catenulispora pinistramenti]